MTGGMVEGAPARPASALARAALDLAAAATVPDVLRISAEASRIVVGAHVGATSRVEGEDWHGATTHVSAAAGHGGWGTAGVAPAGDLPEAVLRAGAPVRLARSTAGVEAALLAAPLLRGDGQGLGVLLVADNGANTFTGGDESLLVQLAQLTANAIDRLELLQRERSARLRAEALQRVGAAITARLELQEIVQLATDAATELTPAQFGAFFYNVLDDRGEAYMLYTLSGVPRSAFERFPMPRNTDIFSPTFNGDGIVRIHDVTADPRYGRNAPYHGMPEGHLPVRSYLAVPVRTSTGEVAGGLFFGHPRPGVFRREDEEMVAGIAAQSAIAIENARLYQERTRTAQTLQRALLPPDLPEIPGVEVAARYRAAGEGNDVGGDFYDVFEVADGGWAIVVGDVCGKGPAAATVTALARFTLRAHAEAEAEPTRLLTRLNDALLRQRAPGFCTVAIACLRPGGGIDLASAGHPLPLLAHDGEVREVGAVGTPLGILPDPELVSAHVELAEHDALVLYTDGLTDAAAPQLGLTDADLAPVVARHVATGPAAVVEALEHLAVDLAGGRPRDDLAILALQAGHGLRHEVVRRFAAGAGAAEAVAEAVGAVRGDLGDDVLADDLRLLATELASNAVRHAQVPGGTIELRIALDRDAVRLSVVDAGAGFDRPATPIGAPGGPGGWGLHLVDERAHDWGVRRDGLTDVWLELRR